LVALVPLLSIVSAIWFSAGWGMSAQETASHR
jgi:hypothetical protein